MIETNGSSQSASALRGSHAAATIARLVLPAAALFMTADPAAAGPLVQLQTTARSELPNDEMVVELVAERSGPAAESLNAEVLDAVGRALAKAKPVPGVSARLGSITTQPDWGPQGQRTGWRVRGIVVLEGRDLKATGTLAGELAADLQIANVSFRLTEAARHRESSRLLSEAATTFRERAKETAAAFGFGGYELKSLNIDHAASPMPPRPMAMSARSAAASASAPPPPLPIEGGDTTVTLHISGSVELK